MIFISIWFVQELCEGAGRLPENKRCLRAPLYCYKEKKRPLNTIEQENDKKLSKLYKCVKIILHYDNLSVTIKSLN